MKKLIVLLVVVNGVACASDPQKPPRSQTDNNIESSDNEQNKSKTLAESLIGAWTATDGILRSIIFSQNTNPGSEKIYIGERQVDCIRAPCLPAREEGSWRIDTNKLIISVGNTTNSYQALVSEDSLVLKDAKTIVASLKKVETTWCGKDSDCDLQEWIHPECVGYAICTSHNTCSWECSDIQKPGECDLHEAESCEKPQICVEIEPGSQKGTCQPFSHGIAVGKGYPCGGSIGAACASGLKCIMPKQPSGMVGGTGVCQ